MKVYLLTENVKWEGSTVFGVFATQEAAEKEIREKEYFDEDGRSWFTIVEHEVKWDL